MENTVFERNYEIVEKDDRATAVFERAFAPGGFMEEYTKKWEKIFYTSSAHFVPFPLHFTCFPSLLKATVSTCSAPLCG